MYACVYVCMYTIYMCIYNKMTIYVYVYVCVCMYITRAHTHTNKGASDCALACRSYRYRELPPLSSAHEALATSTVLSMAETTPASGAGQCKRSCDAVLRL